MAAATMDLPRISFVVPVYDVESFIDECVQSLVAASLPGDEIVLVDDGSRDGSGSRCEAWQAREPQRIRLIRQTNQGLSAARNAGLAASRHRYVLFMDSDDVVLPAGVAAARELLGRHEPDLLVCDFVWWHPEDPQPEVASRPLSHAPAIPLEDRSAFTADTLADFLLSACSRFFARSLLGRLGPAPFPVGVAYEELHSVPRLTWRARRLVYLPQPLFRYRMRAGSITHSPTERHCRHRLTALETFLREVVAERHDARLELLANLRVAQLLTVAIRDCGMMQPQSPGLYRELVDTAMRMFTLPVPVILRGLRAAPQIELRRAAPHLWLAYRAPALYIALRRLVYGRQRRRRQRRVAVAPAVAPSIGSGGPRP